MTASVDVTLKLHSVFGDAVDFRQTEYLIPSAVGENRSVPVHKAMQPARFFYNLLTRTQVQMIGVCENNLCVHFFESFGKHGLDGGFRADRHINGGFDVAVRRMQNARPRMRVGTFFEQFVSYCHGLRHSCLFVVFDVSEFVQIERTVSPVIAHFHPQGEIDFGIEHFLDVASCGRPDFFEHLSVFADENSFV